MSCQMNPTEIVPGKINIQFDQAQRGYHLYAFLTCGQVQNYKKDIPLAKSAEIDFYEHAWKKEQQRHIRRTRNRIRYI
jgi:hypothetical protein